MIVRPRGDGKNGEIKNQRPFDKHRGEYRAGRSKIQAQGF